MASFVQCFLAFVLFVLIHIPTDGFALLEHFCIFDYVRRRAGVFKYPLVREIPRKRESGLRFQSLSTGWAPIRFMVSLKDVQAPSSYCVKAGEKRSDFRGGTIACEEQSILTAEKNATLVDTFIPGAVQLHMDRLLVRSVSALLVVPNFTSGFCQYFTVPEEHHSVGVDGADMVLYIAAAPTVGATLAWSMTCGWLKDGRPAVGVMNFGPQFILTTLHGIRITAHEIAHALGFNYDQMRLLKMVKKVPNVRGKSHVLVVSTPKVLKKTRQHYNCSIVKGMELEDEGGKGTAQSHWERRNAKDELMAGVSGIGYYTAITMAFFDDMKFYRANWGMEEPMSWGKNSGCDLLTDSCLQNGTTAYPDMFCNNLPTDNLICTSDKLALGYCSTTKYVAPLPFIYRYFASWNTGGQHESLTDHCPFVAPYSNSRCKDSSTFVLPGSRFGSNSRCLKGENLQIDRLIVSDICADVLCENATLKVRLVGDETWFPCTEAEFITPMNVFTHGRVLCPKYDDVCTTRISGESYITVRNDSSPITFSISAPTESISCKGSSSENPPNSANEFISFDDIYEWILLMGIVVWIAFLLHTIWLLVLLVFNFLKKRMDFIFTHFYSWRKGVNASKDSRIRRMRRRSSCSTAEVCITFSVLAK